MDNFAFLCIHGRFLVNRLVISFVYLRIVVSGYPLDASVLIPLPFLAFEYLFLLIYLTISCTIFYAKMYIISWIFGLWPMNKHLSILLDAS